MPRSAHKSGKPHALEIEEQDGETQNGGPTETLSDFLRDMHGESTESAGDQNQARPADDPNRLPSFGWLQEHFKTKSAIIRYLTITRGFEVKQVAKHTGFKYQHVRNVTKQQLKRGPNESYAIPSNNPSNPSINPSNISEEDEDDFV